MKSLISVNIEIDRVWPTERDLERRNVVIDQLASRETGTFVGAGCGVGGMDIEYEVDRKSEEAVKSVIKDALAKEFPDKKFTVQAFRIEKSQNVANDRRQPKAQVVKQSQLDFGRGM